MWGGVWWQPIGLRPPWREDRPMCCPRVLSLGAKHAGGVVCPGLALLLSAAGLQVCVRLLMSVDIRLYTPLVISFGQAAIPRRPGR